jgi:hypothetical protein
LENVVPAEVIQGLRYIVAASYVDNEEIFNICIDFWNKWSNRLYESEFARSGGGLLGLDFGGAARGGEARSIQTEKLAYFAPILHEARMIHILKMAKPEEVLVYTDENGVRHELNPSQNVYHKPQFNLSHFWTPNEKFTWSNVAYLSIGRGGGEAFISTSNFTRDSLTGVYDLTSNYQQNSNYINKGYDSLLTNSNENWIIRRSVNNHFWYGLLSTLNYNPIKRLSIMGGLDLRSYRGTHYQEVANLFGGDYYIDDQNNLEPRPLYPKDPNISFRKKKEGDKINYNNDGKKDIFSYTPGGFLVYKNSGNAIDGLSFELVSSKVYSTIFLIIFHYMLRVLIFLQ